MTIKEIEELCGMTRANIRFYESEGLLSPARNSNGYRDYSKNDREVLTRIKLLRTLNISLEEIKSLHTGEQELLNALNQHLKKLEFDRTNIESSQEICKVMHSDGVRYQTLDAKRYLDAMESITQKPIPELVADAVPKVYSPWRRYFARMFDFDIYLTFWAVFLTSVLNINVGTRGNSESLIDAIVVPMLMLFIEPALLAIFGTTPGKWILGIRVTDKDDRHLSYLEALSRTWSVLWRGMGGINIPIYSLVRQWKSYKECDDGKTLDWENNSTITLRDERIWRNAAIIGAYVILYAILILVLFIPKVPIHRGEITVAEFSQNYNRFADYYKANPGGYLDVSGKWVEDESLQNYQDAFDFDYESPEFFFTVEDGVMTGMQLSVNLINETGITPSYQREMNLALVSFIQAQENCDIFSGVIDDTINQIAESPFEDFQFYIYGISIACDVEYSGYKGKILHALFPEHDAETEFTLNFEMIKE